MLLQYDPDIPFLDIHPREVKPYGHAKIFIWMFVQHYSWESKSGNIIWYNMVYSCNKISLDNKKMKYWYVLQYG